MTIQRLLKELNQLSIDIELTEDEEYKQILKTFAELKIKYLTGLMKDL